MVWRRRRLIAGEGASYVEKCTIRMQPLWVARPVTPGYLGLPTRYWRFRASGCEPIMVERRSSIGPWSRNLHDDRNRKDVPVGRSGGIHRQSLHLQDAISQLDPLVTSAIRGLPSGSIPCENWRSCCSRIACIPQAGMKRFGNFVLRSMIWCIRNSSARFKTGLGSRATFLFRQDSVSP